MGVIYSDYAEDRDKALEYYKQVNEICKKYNNMIVSEVVALTNIGETYFYHQDYQLSLKYFEETKEKAKKGDFEASVFYAYTFLCRIHLRLGNYRSAYEYYQLCNIELDGYPLHGREIGEYYMACAELNLEFANLQEAHKFAYKAFKSYEKEESVLKLNSEFLLNYIKLVNDFDDNFSKYIGKINKIIDNISYVGNKVRLLYKLSRFLYYKGYLEQGKKILDKIDNLFNNEYKSNYIKINIMYLKALYNEDNKIQALNEVLELVKRSCNYRLEGEIYAEIGQCYFNNKEYVYSFIYYFECCQRLVNLIEQLPGKCVFNVINIYNIRDPFRRLNMLKQHYCKSKFVEVIDEDIINRYKFKYDNVEDIKNIVNCRNVFENKYFMREIRKLQGILSHNKINDIRKLLNNLTSDNIENLQLILQYLLHLTMGTEGYIITKQNNEYTCIVSINKDRQISNEDFKIIDKVNDTKQPLLISNLYSYENIQYFNKNIRGCICVPIVIKKSLEKDYITDRRTKNSYGNSRLIGYLYIKTERALNNFTEKSLKKCMQLNGLIGIIIEKYKLKIIASFDKLTGTLTRKYLEEAIEENIDLASENEESFSMIMFDLDHFKKVNDRFGHQTGDEVLKQVCEVIRENIRSTDTCGRYGGEEFIIILKNTNIKYAAKIAEKLRIKVENAKILGDKADVTISMGIISYPEHGQWKQQLIEKIDQALYMAKESGRNQCKVWNKDFSNKVKSTDKLTGIITENEVQNNRNVLVMVELLELVNQNISFEQKIYKILGRIIEITEAQYGILFKIKDDLIEKTFSRKNFNEDWITMPIYDENIIKSVINKKQGVYMIDWDNIIKKDSLIKTPDWHSIIVVPMIKKGKINAILYLSVSVKMKEFTFKEFNFVNTLSKIITMIL
ncbi:diguanylate cyclase [Haloimpatiens sp. FM7330]|uniref:diguanylate cyclase n=1 Tax=Haloimpatiens sp. FM7330 TaxID=3298610 RepID=UPI003625523D